LFFVEGQVSVIMFRVLLVLLIGQVVLIVSDDIALYEVVQIGAFLHLLVLLRRQLLL